MLASKQAPDRTGRPPAVLYIMGTGRSGSTVLEIALAQAAGAHGGGELFDVIDDGLRRDLDCSCGQAFSRCPVWGPVAQALRPLAPDPDALCRRFRKIEWHHGFWRRWPLSAPLPAEYTNYQLAVIRALQGVSGASTIVDSSKYPARALALNRLLDDDLRVIWLLRKPEGILQSFRKPNRDEQKPKSTWRAAAYVLYVTLCCRLARARLGPRCLVVHYEQFMRDPARELARIGDWAGMDVQAAVQNLAAGAPMPVGHLLTANRLRKNSQITLKTESPTEGRRSMAIRLCVALLGVWYALIDRG